MLKKAYSIIFGVSFILSGVAVLGLSIVFPNSPEGLGLPIPIISQGLGWLPGYLFCALQIITYLIALSLAIVGFGWVIITENKEDRLVIFWLVPLAVLILLVGPHILVMAVFSGVIFLVLLFFYKIYWLFS